MLEECEEGHVYRGKIIDFDTVDYVPKVRLARGMTVDSKEGAQRVNFTRSTNNKQIIDATSLNIGDQVLVLGKPHGYRENSTSPSIIMIPERQQVLFARERDMLSWKGGLADYIQVISYCSVIILTVIGQVIALFAFGPLPIPNLILSIQLGLLSLIFFFILVGIDWYRSHITRPILVRCDSETWNSIGEDVSRRFSIPVI